MIGLYAFGVLIFLPEGVFNLASGYLWGPWGILINIAGSTIGSTIAFLLGKTLARRFDY